jgi:hypothetical protein
MEEEADAEDAWEIIEDQRGRYEALPRVPIEMESIWKNEFAVSAGNDWEAFRCESMNKFFLNWLTEIERQWGADSKDLFSILFQPAD